MIWVVMQYVIDAFCTGFALCGIVALVIMHRVMKVLPKSPLQVLDDRQKYRKYMLIAMIGNALLYGSYTGSRILEWLTN